MNGTLIKFPDNLRDGIFALEEYALEELEPAELEWVHRFAPGVYSREMVVPEGVLITGAIHKTEHISIFLEGKMLVPDGKGDSMIIEAPQVEIAQPGVKRVGVALERVRWITVHPTELRDVAACEEAFFTNNPEDVPDVKSRAKVIDEAGFAMLQREQNDMISQTTEGET